ncbi:uncharacterized protein LOC131253351 isoform X2 [Magnolia sinica]|uniref:uncharacterized protein LOC131253351 isoform X2 n=1 Tax=Magnolia sinica TaxID=86752 RepID=UPI002658B97B|nr:uncharacterized protein LOC131253351 isoform X2 [Magnolia sinica]
MASSSKFELSSGSSDGPYPSGQRGSYAAASLDRSGSFREGMENRASALPGMSRSGSTLSHIDMMNFLQSLPFDAKVMVAEQKFPRQGELKRVLMSALSISPSDSLSGAFSGKPLPASSLEELRRVRATLHENSVKASDLAKSLNDGISKIDKYCQGAPSRKRSRPDVSSERSNVLLLGDRSVQGGTVSKMGSQSHLNSSGFELGPQKSEEKTRNTVPNKRVRTSMADMDVRASSLARPSVPVDRDRDMFKLVNGVAAPSEEKGRTLAAGVDGWEKSKMRKKRSGIKSDVSTSAVMSRPLDGDREPKRLIQQRLGTDARSRLSNVLGFRSGPGNGAVGVGKLDVTSQQNSPGMRSGPRGEQDSPTLPNDRRERLVGMDKERVTLKAVNKASTREDNSAASPTSIMKMSASVRAPRSSSGALHKSSPNVHRAIGTPDDWEHSQSTNKLTAIVGANNRKRPTSARSSSPPVAQWVGQRPQKMSRVARRTNFPLVSSHDEETVANVSGADNGLGFQRRLSGNTPQQVKLKGDNVSSAGQSESEESGAPENKSKDKGKKCTEVDEKAGPSGTPALPRKNKMATDEDLGDVLRRQGRTGRGFAPSRSSLPAMEKHSNAATAKQLRSARVGSEKIESKAGRPPTKKLSDRKAYTRPRHAINGGSSEFAGESDDDHEELLAAANAVLDTSHACSSSFWKQIEPVFGLVSAEDIAFLKQQIRLVDESAANIFVPSDSDPNSKGDLGPSTPALVCTDDGAPGTNGTGSNEAERDTCFVSEEKQFQSLVDKFGPGFLDHHVIPLSLRIVAAAIHVDEIEELYCETYDSYGIRLEQDTNLKPQSLNQRSLENLLTVGRVASNGYRVTTTQRYLDELELAELEGDVVTDSSIKTVSNFGHSLNVLQPKQAVISSMACTKFQYEKMSFDDRILLELQSIGISSESLGEEDDISEDISRLEEKLHEQVMQKKSMLVKLEKAVLEAREVQERGIERLALDKLIGMAYDKYMACRGPNASGGKGGSNKINKRVVLAFVKRALARYQKFEESGKSCFSEPAFRDMFLSLSSYSNDTECVDAVTDGEAANPYADTPARPSEIRTSGTAAPFGSHSTCLNSQAGQKVDSNDKYSSDASQSANHLPEQTFVKEDMWSNRVKQRELLLHDVVGSAGGTSLRTTSGLGSSLVSGTKGKRSERERDGKGHNRELSRNVTAKVGRPSLSNVKGERKSKAKPKQKTTQLSASVNGLLGKASEQPRATLPPVTKLRDMPIVGNTKAKDEFGLDSMCDASNDPEALDLSHLPLPVMDDLVVTEDLDGQAQDLGSWLNNFDDDGLQGHDFMGLDIPMDDLSDLNMMV